MPNGLVICLGIDHEELQLRISEMEMMGSLLPFCINFFHVWAEAFILGEIAVGMMDPKGVLINHLCRFECKSDVFSI